MKTRIYFMTFVALVSAWLASEGAEPTKGAKLATPEICNHNNPTWTVGDVGGDYQSIINKDDVLNIEGPQAGNRPTYRVKFKDRSSTMPHPFSGIHDVEFVAARAGTNLSKDELHKVFDSIDASVSSGPYKDDYLHALYDKIVHADFVGEYFVGVAAVVTPNPPGHPGSKVIPTLIVFAKSVQNPNECRAFGIVFVKLDEYGSLLAKQAPRVGESMYKPNMFKFQGGVIHGEEN
jgi:hypothetical protein